MWASKIYKWEDRRHIRFRNGHVLPKSCVCVSDHVAPCQVRTAVICLHSNKPTSGALLPIGLVEVDALRAPSPRVLLVPTLKVWLLGRYALHARLLRGCRAAAKSGHGRPPVGDLPGGCFFFGGADADVGGEGHFSGGVGRARLGRGTSGVGGVVDVFAIDVGSVGDKGGATMTAAGVALFKTEQLDLGLDAVEETETHCDGFLMVL